MAEERELDPRLNDLEQTLSKLAPKSPRMDVAQAMYLAGQQSALAQRPRQIMWPIAATVLFAVSATLGTLLALPGEPQIVYVNPDGQFEEDGTVQQPRDDNRVPGHDEQPGEESRTNDGTVEEALEFFRSLRLAHDGSLDNLLPVTPVSAATNVSPLRYSDWRAELDQQRLQPSVLEPESHLWLQILSTKGSL